MKDLLIRLLQKQSFEPNLIEEILTSGRQKKLKTGDELVSTDSGGVEMPFVLSGSLKVMRRDENGQEFFLYFLDIGDTCAMSVTCCIEKRKAPIHVIAEEDAALWMIPTSLLDEWIKRYESFRKFVFRSYQTRFDEMLNTIDTIIFHNMDERLYRYLLDKKQISGSFEIHKTHNQIAHELNTSRVVVSRLLKKLEKEGKIEQYRNRIDIL